MAEAGRVRHSAGSVPDEAADLAGLIDLERYPLQEPGSAGYAGMLETARRGLAASGACVFEGFLRPAAIDRVLAEADPLRPAAFVCGQPHNVYLVASDPALPADHARNRLVDSVKAILADDEIPPASPLRTLYAWEGFRRFVREALGIEQMFPFADPLAPININFYGDGQALGWHFDNSKFTVTLMLRQAEQGGVFEYAPNIREDGPEGFARVGRILEGDHREVLELSQDPGALVLFKGSRSLHRVTPSFGGAPRTIAILSYTSEPGRGLMEHTRMIFYGRTGARDARPGRS
ncbi:MAG: 2OG-Fe(II) oxygenase family protein [Dongiaceae bacterium]